MDTPMGYYRYLRRQWAYPPRLALWSTFMRFCKTAEDCHARMRRAAPNLTLEDVKAHLLAL